MFAVNWNINKAAANTTKKKSPRIMALKSYRIRRRKKLFNPPSTNEYNENANNNDVVICNSKVVFSIQLYKKSILFTQKSESWMEKNRRVMLYKINIFTCFRFIFYPLALWIHHQKMLEINFKVINYWFL